MLFYALLCIFSLAAWLAVCSCAFYVMGSIYGFLSKVILVVHFCLLVVVWCSPNIKTETRVVGTVCLFLYYGLLYKTSIWMSEFYTFVSVQLWNAARFMYNWAMSTSWLFRVNLISAFLLAFATNFNDALYAKFVDGGSLLQMLYAGFAAM